MKPLLNAFSGFFHSQQVRRRTERTAKRALEAASLGWRVDQSAAAPRMNADVLAGGRTVRARARHALMNNALAARSVGSIVGASVGKGFTARSAHPAETERRRLSADFALWAEACGPDRASLGSITEQVATAVVRDGEAIVLLETDTDGDFRVKPIDIAQLDSELHRDLGEGARVIAGVEFNARDERVAYHIHPRPLDEPFATLPSPVRVDARFVLHVFRRDFIGQVRGLSWLSASLRTLQDLDAACDALLVKMKSEALIVAFLRDQTGDGAALLDGERDGDVLNASLEPGTMVRLPPGKDVTSMTPTGTASGAIDLIKMHQRIAALGIGATYEQASGDLSGVNYSSIRAGLIEFRRRVRAFQDHVLIPQLLRPVWMRWLEIETMAGRTDAASPGATRAQTSAVRWIPPGFAYADPLKELQADIEAIDAGLKSRREVVAERGVDLDELRAEMAEDEILNDERPSTASSPAEEKAGENEDEEIEEETEDAI